MNFRYRLTLVLLLAGMCARLQAFVFIEGLPAWPDGTVTLELQLGSSPTYSDGTTPNSTAIQALQSWNPSMARVQFAYVNNSGAAKSKTNGKNNVFFAANVFGTAFGDGVLAVTVGRTQASGPVEMDVVVNNRESWDSYRGSYQVTKTDLRRVLAHEFGHVLGLDHPDEHGQWMTALMNSYVSDVDTVQQDDKDGVSVRYGRGPGNPATPPVINNHPIGGQFVEGQDLALFSLASGSQPLTFQWFKNGEPLPGATDYRLELLSLRTTDAGSYFMRATNDAASVDSNTATVLVTAATVPVITQQPPASITVEAGAYIYLYAGASSNASITYQWLRDDEPVPGANDVFLHISPVTEAHAGTYRLQATNVAGTAKSDPCTLIVVPTKPPTITTHPASGTATLGKTFSFSASATSAVTLSYQWFHNGEPIPGATQAYHTIMAVRIEDAGEYHMTATNIAGATTSRTASLTVEPLPPPTQTVLSNYGTQVGSTFTLYGMSSESDASFQWYHDGVPIPDATGPTLTRTNLRLADAGEYFVVVTNATGSTTSTVAVITIAEPDSSPSGGWRQARSHAGIAYFMFENPARIERFDMTSETWLPAISLVRSPLAMAIESSQTALVGAYRSIHRIDLASGQETLLASLPTDPIDLTVEEQRLYVVALDPEYDTTRRLGSLSLSTPGAVTWSARNWMIGTSVAIDTMHAKAFLVGASPGACVAIPILEDGTFGEVAVSPGYNPPTAVRSVHLRPDASYIYDDTGALYSTTDLTYRGSLGSGFEAIAFQSDNTCLALRGSTVVAFGPRPSETGRLTLSRPAHHLAIHGSSFFTFAQPSGGGVAISWEKHLLTEVKAAEPLPAVAPATLDYTVDDAALDRDGTLLLLSRLHGNILRWSTREQRYLEPIRLRGRPNHMSYSTARHRLFLAYATGAIRSIDLDADLVETDFVAVPDRIGSLCATDQHLVVYDITSNRARLRVFDLAGNLVSSRDGTSGALFPVWNPTRQRVYYFRDWQPLASFHWTEVSDEGLLGLTQSSSFLLDGSVRAPLRLAPSGDFLLIGSGQFFSADTLVQNNSLPHGMIDSAWSGGRLFTARDTVEGCEVKRWGGSNYGEDARRMLRGRTLRLVSCGDDRIIAVTSRANRPHFTLLDADLNVRNHFEDTPDLTKVALTNLSTRAEVGTGDDIIIAGFVVTGSQAKRILVRAVGPELNRFGVAGTLADPVLTVISDTGPVAENDNWSTPDGEAMKAAFREVFAFGLADNSLDSALVAELAPGKYTAQVSGKDGGQGVALVEAYDLDADPGERRLINISTRAVVGVGDKVLIPGLAIEGSAPKRLLIRAAGPELTRFGVGGVLADPTIQVINADDEVVAANDNWGDDNTEVTMAATSAANAFRLASGGRDAALVVTLPPGSYTVVVSGVDDTSGVALVEVYEVP